MAEGGSILLVIYAFTVVYAINLYYKNLKTKEPKELIFYATSLLVLYFHSLVDNFFLAKNNEYLFMFFFAVLSIYLKENNLNKDIA